MRIARKKIAIQTATTAAFADVTVRVTGPAAEPLVRVAPALSGGHADWNDAAISGARWAMRAAGSVSEVEIVELVGITVDTSRISVAIAAAEALWQALEFPPPAGLLDAFDAMLRRKVDFDADPLPVLDEALHRCIHDDAECAPVTQGADG